MEDAPNDTPPASSQPPSAAEQTREPSVADAFGALQDRGVRVLHRVLLGREENGRRETARISEVVVDESGVWVVDVLSPRRAVVHGRYSDRTWSARYPEGRTEILTNPIRYNDHHVGLMHELLREAGWGVTLDHVRGVVVFEGADLSELHLDSVNAVRVTDVAGIPERYAERTQTASVGHLPAEQVTRLAEVVAGLDRSNDPEYAGSHAVWRGEDPEIPESDQTDQSAEAGLPIRSAGDPEVVRQRVVLIAALALLVAGAVAAVFALRGIVDKPRRLDSAPAPVAVPQASPGVSPPVVEEQVAPVKRDVGLAKRRLKETYPRLYNAVQDIDNPRVGDLVAGQITYEWDYLEKSSSNAVTVGTVSITLDSEGVVVGSTD